MRTAVRLVVFAAVVATGFGVGAAIGDVVGPVDPGGRPAHDDMPRPADVAPHAGGDGGH